MTTRDTSPSIERKQNYPPNATPEAGRYPDSIDTANAELHSQETQLKVCTIGEAIETFLGEQTEYAPSTTRQYVSVLRFFNRWASQQDIDYASELTPLHVIQFRNWRQHRAPVKVPSLKKITINSQMAKIRRFLRWCETINVVTPGLPETVDFIRIVDEEDVRHEVLDPEKAQTIQRHLNKWQYATRDHVTWILKLEFGARTGDIRCVDIEDLELEGNHPYLQLRHRPDRGTRLKNGKQSERTIALSPEACRVLVDYLECNRIEVVDEYGRRPLLTTTNGRISKSTIRSYSYKWTRPCKIGLGCPHGKDDDKCPAAGSKGAHKCPSSQSSHCARKGYLTYELNSGVDPVHLSGRCDVSEEVLSKHYDMRSEQEQMFVRRRAFENARLSYQSFGGAENDR